MANRKVKDEDRKRLISFTIKEKNISYMKKYCLENELSFSKIVDELITNYKQKIK